ncbi:hypothetical protein NHX12_013558 [Muraenolepis orangiensis]|uniref:Uncharacterized protein n=1 Tax=Muraenolepis orangiensis TaxID=630683 RepID=A0A9Q0I611_9TELE|nr:hypothetical protein NHX12_013558 [Muraenolepis orangiensis]
MRRRGEEEARRRGEEEVTRRRGEEKVTRRRGEEEVTRRRGGGEEKVTRRTGEGVLEGEEENTWRQPVRTMAAPQCTHCVIPDDITAEL